jgi:dTMP kinase
MFVVFEGIDGSGKSTVAKALLERLSTARPGQKVKLEAEPTYQGVGKVLRDILQRQDRQAIQDHRFVEYLALAMAADRQLHYWYQIRPELQRDTWVLCDRFCWSSYAYQGALGVNLNWLATLNAKVPVPDLTVLIKLDPEVAVQRIQNKKSSELFEDVELLKKVAECYRYLAVQKTGIHQVDHARLLVVDGTKPVDQLVEEIYTELIKLER